MRKKIVEIDNPLEFRSQIQESQDLKREQNSRSFVNGRILYFVLSLVLFLLLSRTFYIQLIKGDYYKEVSENNRIRTTPVYAPRGLIEDSFGEVLARNTAAFDLIFVPAYLPKEKEQRLDVYSRLAEIIDLNELEITELVESFLKNDRRQHILKEDINKDLALRLIEKLDFLEGFEVAKIAKRIYLDSEYFSHVIGYDGKINESELQNNPNYLLTDYVGKTGLEYSYEKPLHGQHGFHRYEVDSRGVVSEDLGVKDSLSGKTLILNLDANFQRKAHDILSDILVENEDATGAVMIAIDPRNGAIRALVSLPSFDNNLFASGISSDDYNAYIDDEENPLLNRAIAGEFPPGSTFKPMIAVAALEENIIKEDTVVDCRGGISLGSWVFPDWKAHGVTDVKKAIAESCDVFFYAIGGGWQNISALGVERMGRYARLFGFGQVLGIDLPGELDGNIPSDEWKQLQFAEKWYPGDNYHMSIGQGFVTATPLQLVSMTATIANGGFLYRPQLLDKLKDVENDKIEDIQAEFVDRNFVSKNSIRIVQEGMRQTVIGSAGSGRKLASLNVKTAGKTGTAQFGNEEKLHSWYIAYGPYENPELATVVLIEGGGEGHDWAVPATYELYNWYFDEERGTKPKKIEEEKYIEDQKKEL